MFKAKKKNPKQKRTFRKRIDDEEEEDDDDKAKEGGAAESIARIKKKRKLLTELQFKKGTDAATLLKGRQKEEEDLAQNVETVADPSTTASSSQEGIMEQKHKQALENYVESKLADMVGDKDKDQPEQDDKNNNTSKKLTKDELYKQLAESSDHMVGRRPSATDSTKKDGDVGTGGAMLVAGTGLAEVILPVDQRLKTVQETQKETLPPQAKNKNYYYGMPSSQVPVPAGAARFQVSAADRHRHFAASSSQHDSSKSSDTISAAAQQQQQEPQQETTSNDQDRMGFDALRGKTTAGTAGGTNGNSSTTNNSSGNHDHRNRASDDKVYGNFLKHHRENQWRTGR